MRIKARITRDRRIEPENADIKRGIIWVFSIYLPMKGGKKPIRERRIKERTKTSTHILNILRRRIK